MHLQSCNRSQPKPAPILLRCVDRQMGQRKKRIGEVADAGGARPLMSDGCKPTVHDGIAFVFLAVGFLEHAVEISDARLSKNGVNGLG